MSQNRRRRFRSSQVYQQIFDEIVELACRGGWVTGKVLYTDSTHLKANANKNQFDVVRVEVKPVEYLAQLEAAIAEDRERARQGGVASEGGGGGEEGDQAKPDGCGRRVHGARRQAEGLFLSRSPHGGGRHAIITDTHVTPANVHDSVPYLGRLDRQRQRFGFAVEAVGLDAGYATAAIAKGLEERDIYGVIGYRTPNDGEGLFRKRQFRYDAERDVYVCPAGQLLVYRTTNREGYRQYHSDRRAMPRCPLRQQCTRSRNATKIVTRHVWQRCKDQVDAHRLEPRGKRIYKRRKETVERSFADAKQLHGHRYARMRGLAGVQEQSLLAAVAQNLKKMALLLSAAGPPMPPGTRHEFLLAYVRLLQLTVAIYPVHQLNQH